MPISNHIALIISNYSNYNQIDEKINLYGQENIDFTMNIVNPYYLDYYLRFKKLE